MCQQDLPSIPTGPGYVVTSVAMKQVPGYWVFNAMLKRPLTEKLEFQANVNNLFNRYYIDLPHPSHLDSGSGSQRADRRQLQIQIDKRTCA